MKLNDDPDDKMNAALVVLRVVVVPPLIFVNAKARTTHLSLEGVDGKSTSATSSSKHRAK